MAGERDLARLLQGLRPKLYPERYSFAETADPTLRNGQFALIREDESLTSVQLDSNGAWARISLEVHSSLEAVGLTAEISSRLTEKGISANIVAALNHDHLFVPWDRRGEALAVLRSLQGSASE